MPDIWQKEDSMELLKQKLSSRKLWAAVATGVMCIAAACFGDQLTPEAVEVLKYAAAAGMTYIFGEGIVDAARQIAGKMAEAGALREGESKPTEGDTEDTVEGNTETDDVVIEFTE